MNNFTITEQTKAAFENLRHTNNSVEYWSARELMPALGYRKWQKFEGVIDRAQVACFNSGSTPENHFTGSGKLLNRGNRGGSQEVVDYHLSRYACYLVAQNGDPRKPAIAAAQSYFAIKTREAETAGLAQEPCELEKLKLELALAQSRLELALVRSQEDLVQTKLDLTQRKPQCCTSKTSLNRNGRRAVPPSTKATDSAFLPHKTEASGRQAFAKVLMHCRETAGCNNWATFCEMAFAECGVIIRQSAIEKMSPSPSFTNLPDAGTLFALEYWGRFTFSNGERVTSFALMQVLLGFRSADGRLTGWQRCLGGVND